MRRSSVSSPFHGEVARSAAERRRGSALPRDLAEVGDLAHDVSNLAQQFQAVFALGGDVGVNQNVVEEAVDGRAQARQGRHGGGEVLGLQRGLDGGAGGADGEGQGLSLIHI